MMGSDARDVLGLPSAAPPKPTPAKTQKPRGRGPSEDLQCYLMGSVY